jgi:glycosyltransferase involved in cell wall biosynthesis
MKQRILHVIANLRHGRAARQMTLLLGALPRERFESRVLALGGDGPVSSAVVAAGVPVEALRWQPRLDPRPLWALYQRIEAFRPDVIHAWHLAALPAIRLTARRGTPIVVSRPVHRHLDGLRGQFARWLLRAANRITFAGAAEEEHCRKLGFVVESLSPARLAVGVPETRPREEVLAELRRVSPAIPAEVRFIACVGPLERHKALQDAVWAFALLQYLYNDLHLLVIGTGPEEEQLRRFARDQGVSDRVHLIGDRSDLGEVLSACEVAWVPGRRGAVGAILEAMAAGRPVMAIRRAETIELLGEDEAGVLLPPSAPCQLARQTRVVLEDAGLARRLGEAGRRRALRDFAVADMARDHEAIYHAFAT